MAKLREIVKFAAGIAAWESVVHASLWISGSEPVIFGIVLTTKINMVQTIIPGIVAILLAWFAWGKKEVVL